MLKLVSPVIGFAILVAVAAPRGAEQDRPARQVRGEAGETRIDRSDDGHFYVEASVNDQPVRFMVDTGATPVALTLADAERIGIEVEREAFQVVGSGASGPVHGERLVLDSVDIDGKTATGVRAAVVDGLDVSLLGQAYLAQLERVEISGDEMVLR